MKNAQTLLKQLKEMFLSENATFFLPPQAQNLLRKLGESVQTENKARQLPSQATQSYYKLLFERAPVAIITLDKQGLVLSLNTEASTMLEISDNQTNASFAEYLEDASKDTFKRHLSDLFSSKKSQKCEIRISFTTFDGQQHEHDLVLDSTWMKEDSGMREHCLSICNDISGFKKLQSDLEDGRIQAEKASSMKSQFLANMSHEIRTPLSSILGYVDLLRQEIQEEGQREQLEIVNKAGKHLLYLINEILDLSKIEHGGFTLKHNPFSLSAMLNDLQNLFEIAAEKRNIRLVFSTGFIREPLVGDATRIRQILVNVIGNAIKFTPPKGQVKVHVFYQIDYLIIRVSDTGPGIEQEQIEAIFEMFHQADNSDTRTHGGSGLGLAISQKLSRMMNGTIEIESQMGVGSTFTIRVPLDALDIAEDPDDYIDNSGILPAPFFAENMETTPRVLIVDDDRVLQRLLGIFIQRMGYEHSIAIHGKDALQKLEKEVFSLVLLDLQMPIMDGYETAKEMRKRKEFKHIPVIALTAKAIQDDLDRCLSAGCDTYLTKPITYKHLARQIHRYLRPIDEDTI